MPILHSPRSVTHICTYIFHRNQGFSPFSSLINISIRVRVYSQADFEKFALWLTSAMNRFFATQTHS